VSSTFLPPAPAGGGLFWNKKIIVNWGWDFQIVTPFSRQFDRLLNFSV
jgi:hypothetical protein